MTRRDFYNLENAQRVIGLFADCICRFTIANEASLTLLGTSRFEIIPGETYNSSVFTLEFDAPVSTRLLNGEILRLVDPKLNTLELLNGQRLPAISRLLNSMLLIDQTL